jgi:hypothetical protein
MVVYQTHPVGGVRATKTATGKRRTESPTPSTGQPPAPPERRDDGEEGEEEEEVTDK